MDESPEEFLDLPESELLYRDASDTNQYAEATAAPVLNEVLDKLCRPLDHNPPSVSHWSDSCHDTAIRNCFRMRRCLVTPNDFLARYLYRGNVSLFEKYFLESEEVRAVLNFVEKSTASANFTETELFLHPKDDRKTICGLKSASLLTSASEVLRSNTLDPAEKFSTFKRVAIHLKTRVYDWLEALADTVAKSPGTVMESEYEEIFKLFVKVFSLKCLNNVKLGIPYRNEMKISSVPDILLRRDQEYKLFCGVVEVKKMILDPSFRHAFTEPSKDGILSGSDDEQKPSKQRRVNFQPEGEPGSSAMEESDEDQLDQTDDSRLTESERQLIKLFFGELFGSVLALDYCQPHGYTDLRKRLGIGVVGFRVVFLAFYSKPAVPFKDVTHDASNRMEVCITSQLSLLNASDRKEIAKILLALAAPEARQIEEE